MREKYKELGLDGLYIKILENEDDISNYINYNKAAEEFLKLE